MTTKPRIKLPEVVRAGEIIEIKALIQHLMETGNRRDEQGRPIPRHIIHTFAVTFEGQPVLRAELGSGISANPFIGFFMRVERPGTLEFTWIDDAGITITETVVLDVTS